MISTELECNLRVAMSSMNNSVTTARVSGDFCNVPRPIEIAATYHHFGFRRARMNAATVNVVKRAAPVSSMAEMLYRHSKDDPDMINIAVGMTYGVF